MVSDIGFQSSENSVLCTFKILKIWNTISQKGNFLMLGYCSTVQFFKPEINNSMGAPPPSKYSKNILLHFHHMQPIIYFLWWAVQHSPNIPQIGHFLFSLVSELPTKSNIWGVKWKISLSLFTDKRILKYLHALSQSRKECSNALLLCL